MDDSDEDYLPRDGRFERIIYMVVFLILFAIGETLLWAVTIAQMIWVAVYGQPNDHVAEFGARLGVWIKRVVLYQSGTTDEKPFPWREID
ncbi:DUF4389 domain-containing protein [Mangrovicoccus sp. HB161399]|uniref:DUF4389 domain-containing protein n=1 Tax=Mangrovicoccus sp. HB161399 TaxID=2720392 RepID=UPI001552D825|nr:DUF4389 domain-containing protein [Mangrovicoccus sp. HB161399]